MIYKQSATDQVKSSWRRLPVKDLPKTNSLGGRGSLGVVVLAIVNFEGSMACNFVVDAASAFMLYNLEDASHRLNTLELGFAKAAPLGNNCLSILTEFALQR